LPQSIYITNNVLRLITICPLVNMCTRYQHHVLFSRVHSEKSCLYGHITSTNDLQMQWS